jgi:hypothetical protein
MGKYTLLTSISRCRNLMLGGGGGLRAEEICEGLQKYGRKVKKNYTDLAFALQSD